MGQKMHLLSRQKVAFLGLNILFCVEIGRERCNSSERSKYFRANIFICYQNFENFGFLLNHKFLSLRSTPENKEMNKFYFHNEGGRMLIMKTMELVRYALIYVDYVLVTFSYEYSAQT